MTVEQAQQLAKQQLSPKRYRHTQNVCRAARTLALRFGADVQQAELAAWLHDIVKEYSREDLLQLMGQDAIMAGSTAERPQPVWHGPCGAIYAKQVLGVADEAVLSAIACHTTGKAGMSLLDKVIFVADAISAERDYPGVDRLRKLAETDLDAVVAAVLEENIAFLKRTNKPLDEETLYALRALRGGG
ncbi:MAG: bis(5'-nucleosyl)-tetraphosphatase (symmetrical) YqeK [Oscillospiraceae bacterium]